MCHCLLLHWIKKLFYGFCLVDSSGDMAGCMSGMLSCCLSYNADSSVQYKRRCEKLVWLSGLEPGLRIKRLLLNPGFSTTFILYDNWYTPHLTPPHLCGTHCWNISHKTLFQTKFKIKSVGHLKTKSLIPGFDFHGFYLTCKTCIEKSVSLEGVPVSGGTVDAQTV